MKPLIALIALTLSSCLPGFAQEETGIRFETVPFSQLLAKAKQEHKLVFIDCYTTWCGPCKWMEKTVFTNDTVAQYYNQHFICAQIDMEKGEGIELAKKYEVKCFPTFLFIDNDGKLVYRKSGAFPAQEFIKTGNDALNPHNQYASLKTSYEAGTITSPDLIRYMRMRQASCLSVDAEVATFFNSDTTALLNNPATWIVLRDFAKGIHSKAFRLLLSNRADFSAQHTADSVNQIMERVYSGAMQEYLFAKDGPDTIGYLNVKKEVHDGNFSFSERLTLQGDFQLYQITKDWNRYAEVAVVYVGKFVGKYPSSDWVLLNSIAWTFYENVNDTVYLDTAIAWAKRSVAIEQSYYNTDTYAALLYKRGKLSEAKIQAEKAIELAKKEGITDYAETEELLDSIRGVKAGNK